MIEKENTEVTKEEQIVLLQTRINELESEKNNLTARALKVHEKNTMLQASPEIAMQVAEMDFQIKMAQQFIASKAFPNMTPEQAFTIIKAGQEMGLKPLEAMNTLYIVNGAIKPYGDKMVAILLKNGYRIKYLNETDESLDVRVYNDNGFDETEHVSANDPILKNSRAMKFAKKNKMRFHGVRMIASFHLSHLFGSVTDEFTGDYRDWENEQPKSINSVDEEKEKQRVLSHIGSANTAKSLLQVEELAMKYGLSKEFNEMLDVLNTKENG